MAENGFQKNTNEQPHVTGVILDGRYKTIRVIGEGGFGITYEAVNIHNSARVAIKECRKEQDKARFLREARVLHDYADEPAIVTVLDNFEENNTAYIVMEYLDGITLSEEIRKNGKWPAEKAVRSMVPVMRSLEKMHSTGVIHRDISPDNLMVMPDGSLILMDFGAALPAEQTEFTRTAIFKAVYSPPEQRDGALETGSWSDVYALCATIYFCITGMEPEDSLSRLLFDELKKPSESGADILPAAEQALIKGLALKKEDRTRDVLTLRTQLENVYPDLSEEEKKEMARRKKRRRNMIIGSVCAACAITAILLYTFRINILFSFIPTETVAFDGREMTDEDYAVSTAIVKERAKVLAKDDRYLFREENRQLFFELPLEDLNGSDFNEVDLPVVIRSSVSRPMVMSVYAVTEENDPYNDFPGKAFGILSQTEDIAGFDPEEKGALITFSKDAAEKLKEPLSQEGQTLRFCFDVDQDFQNMLFYTGETLGDGQTVRVENTGYLYTQTHNSLYTSGEYQVPSALFKMHFTDNPSRAGFGIQTQLMVQWEDTASALFAGKNQKNEDEIPGYTISLGYSLDNMGDNTNGYSGSFMSLQAILKNRLDSLNIPYAVGMELWNNNTYIVKVPVEKVWGEELYYLGNYLIYEMELGSSLAPSSTSILLSVEEHEDGTFSMITLPDSYNTDIYTDTISTASGQGDGKLYLYCKDFPISSCNAETALHTLEEEGSICFDNWTFAFHPDMDETTLHFGSWLEAATLEDPQDACYYNNSYMEIRDVNNKVVFFDDYDYIPEDAFVTEKALTAEELVEQWNTEYAGIFKFSYTSASANLNIQQYNADILDPEAALSEIRKWADSCKDVLNNGSFNWISIGITNSRPDEEIEHYVSIDTYFSFKEGKRILSGVYAGSPSLSQEESNQLANQYEKAVTENPPF